MKLLSYLLVSISLLGCGSDNGHIRDLTSQIENCSTITKQKCSWVVIPPSELEVIEKIYEKHGINYANQETEDIN